MTEEKKDIYDILRDIVDLLKGLNEEERIRVMRWASEMLNIKNVTQGVLQNVKPITTQDVPTTQNAPQTNQQTSLDIKSFIQSKNPISDSHFATTVAYYYQFEAPEKKDAISKDDLVEATRLVGRKRLGRPDQTLVNTTKVGYLDNVSRGLYKLNSVGENLVAMVLPSADKTTTSPKRKKSIQVKPKKKKTGK